MPGNSEDVKLALESLALSPERVLLTTLDERPDPLQKAPRKADLRLVGGKTVIGSGPNRIELYPLRGAASERQMMVYFPAHKLLYGSDPFQKNTSTGSYSLLQPVSELVQAVEREQLQVGRFFMMHMPAAPYNELLEVKGSDD